MRWHLDEVFISINGRQLYVWRAVDSEGEVLDILVQPRRDRKAALKLMRKLLKTQGLTPATIVTDKLGSYRSALRELGIARRHDTGRWKNNRAENSHQPLRQREGRMKRFKSPGFGTALSLNPRCRLQCVQRPTPSDLAPKPALISRSGYADMAPRDSRSVNRCGHAHLACKFPLNVTVAGHLRRLSLVVRSHGGAKLHSHHTCCAPAPLYRHSRLPAQPTSHVLLPVSRLESGASEESTRFRGIVTLRASDQPQTSVSGWRWSPFVIESPKAKNGLAVLGRGYEARRQEWQVHG